MTGEYWSYREWAENTVEKIAVVGAAVSDRDREDYLRAQVSAAIAKALHHGRSGRGDEEPVAF